MKIILTEGQVERLKQKLNEGVDSRYVREISVDFNYYKTLYKGNPIDYIKSTKINVSFDIEIEARSWGIKGIEINGIKGPESVEVLVEYYEGESDEPISDWYVIHLDWSKLVTTNERSGMISVGDIMEVDLVNDAEGRLIVGKMELPLNKL